MGSFRNLHIWFIRLFIAIFIFAYYPLVADEFSENAADPLGLTQEAEDSQLSPADRKARDAATKLRRLALAEVESRRQELAAKGDASEVADFEEHLRQGYFVHKDNPELGTAKVTMIDNDCAVRVTLNSRTFSNTEKTVFLIFNLTQLRPDRNRVKLLLSTLQNQGELTDIHLNGFYHDDAKLDAFVTRVGESQGMDPKDVRNWLNAGSGQLRQHIARLTLESDVQAIGVNGENIVYALFGKRPSFLSPQYWRTWFNAVKSPATAGSITFGFICGAIQGGATYWMAGVAIQKLAEQGLLGSHISLLPIEYVPFIAAAWSFSYGFATAAYNAFYRNVVYHGTTTKRVAKLTIFSAIFGHVYKLITAPIALVTMSGQRHIWTNYLINQYAKDDTYRIARIRESLSLNNRQIVIPNLIPSFVRRLFPRLTRAIPEKIKIEMANIETQASYHVLWTLKMLHFVKLMPVAVFPVAIVLARGCAYGYLGYLHTKKSIEYRRSPTSEKRRQLRKIKQHLRDLNYSWLDIVLIPWEIIKTGRNIIASSAKGVKNVTLRLTRRKPRQHVVTTSGKEIRDRAVGSQRQESPQPRASCQKVYAGFARDIPLPIPTRT